CAVQPFETVTPTNSVSGGARGCLRFFQAEARTAHGDDPHAGADELGTKPAHLHVDHVRAKRLGRVPPGMPGDGLALDHRWEAPHQYLEAVKFGSRKVQRLSAELDMSTRRRQS